MFSEAIVAEEELVKMYENLYKKDSFVWANKLIVALDELSMSYFEISRLHEAIKTKEKMLKIYEETDMADSDMWIEKYAISLNSLATFYANINQTSKAIELEKKSLDILAELYAKDPDRWEGYCTTVLYNFVSIYKKNLIDKAIELKAKAIEIESKLKDKTIKFRDDTIESLKKSLEIYAKLYAEYPNQWAEYYTLTLSSLASFYFVERGQMDEEIKSMYKKAYAISKKHLGENHSSTIKYKELSESQS